MKKEIIHPLFLILLISILSFTCCKEEECDDPTNRMCPNFDICLITPVADASFDMLHFLLPNIVDTLIDIPIDTINSWVTILSKALNTDMESYQWTIGSDARTFTDDEFKIGIGQFEGQVEICLTVTAKDNNGCLDEQQMKNTSCKAFQAIAISSYSMPVFGEYRGSNTSKPDSVYTVTALGEGENFWRSFRLFGLPIYPCDYPIGIRIGFGYDWFISKHDDDHCRNTIVIGRLQEDRKTLNVEYFYDADDGTRVHEFFEGTRI